MILVVDGEPAAVFGLQDTEKESAAATVAALAAMGVQSFMLTGDNFRVAHVVAASIGIPVANVVAEVLPGDKAREIERLQMLGHRVAMVGDGTNDAPALAAADVGVAVGTGTDVAVESASVVLRNEDALTDVVVAVDLARAVLARVRLNLAWALGYNVVAMPLAAGALYPWIHRAVPPWLASAAMALSSVSVVASSLALRAYAPPRLRLEYGREKRRGELGLERVRVLDAKGVVVGEHEIDVGCDMAKGGACSCSPDVCTCRACREHAGLRRV